MAEVRQRLGRGAYDFAQKIYSRQPPDSLSKHGQRATRASLLSGGFLSGDIKQCGSYGGEKDADRATVGATRRGYTRVTAGNVAAIRDILGKGSVVHHHCYIGLKKYSSSNKTHVEMVELLFPRCRGNARFGRTFCTPGPHRWRSCWGHGQLVFTRAYSGNGARPEPLFKSKTGYYEILEVSPSATQVQIKTAYYKQSFIYHPDRNAGSDAATVRFSEISEAYTVLGNKALRKKYDRGLLRQSDLISTARPSAKDGAGGSGKPQSRSRHSVMGANAPGRVFDFDNFFKSHYSEQLQRERDVRSRKEQMLKDKQKDLSEKKMGRMTEMYVTLMMLVALGLLFSLK